MRGLPPPDARASVRPGRGPRLVGRARCASRYRTSAVEIRLMSAGEQSGTGRGAGAVTGGNPCVWFGLATFAHLLRNSLCAAGLKAYVVANSPVADLRPTRHSSDGAAGRLDYVYQSPGHQRRITCGRVFGSARHRARSNVRHARRPGYARRLRRTKRTWRDPGANTEAHSSSEPLAPDLHQSSIQLLCNIRAP